MMKKKYIFGILLIVLLVYLANSNPSKSAYTSWAAKQFMKRNDVSQKLSEIAKEDKGRLFGELAKFGQNVAKKYVEPQVDTLIDHYTERSDYIFFSTYKTEFTIGQDTYKYVSVGIADHFIPVDMPDKKKE